MKKNSFWEWLKLLKYVVSNYTTFKDAVYAAFGRIDKLEAAVGELSRRIDGATKLIKERTNIGVDLHFKTANHVIVVGRYRNVDYVQTYTLPESTLRELVEQLRQMEKFGDIQRMDAPPMISAAWERDKIKRTYEKRV